MTALQTAVAALQGDEQALAEFGIGDPPSDPEASTAALVRERQAQLIHSIAAEADILVGQADPTPPYDIDPDLLAEP